jgi:hypothetical protein
MLKGSRSSFEKFVENGGEKRVEFGGGLGLHALRYFQRFIHNFEQRLNLLALLLSSLAF